MVTHEVDGVVILHKDIRFQYVYGDDRPHIYDIEGEFLELNKTTVGREFISVRVHKIHCTLQEQGHSPQLFWVDRIVQGSFNSFFNKERSS